MRTAGRLVAVLLLLCLGPAWADGAARFDAAMRFQPLAANSKLSQLVINDIVQDKEGFVWIATDDGLNRYDGQDIRVYRPSASDKHAISHFAVKRLAVDQGGKLWVGSEGGLDVYDPLTDRFSQFSSITSNKSSLVDKRIRALMVDSRNRIWIGMRTGGVAMIASDNSSLIHIPLYNPELNGKTLFVHDFFESENGHIYAATRRGLLRFDSKKQQMTQLPLEVQQNVTTAVELPGGNILMGSSKGLWLFNINRTEIESVLPEALASKHIVAIEPFDQRRYFIGTRSDGLYLLDIKDLSLSHFVSDPADKYALSDNQIEVIHHTKDGLFWIGTNIGVNVFNPSQLRFGYFSAHNQHPHCLSGNTIYAIMPDRRQQLWIGAYGHGLNRIDLETSNCELITGLEQADKSQLFKDVVALHEQGPLIWIATFKDGVVQYDSEKDRFTPLDELVDTAAKLPMNVQALSHDSEGNLWIATYDAGLFRYEPKNRQIFNVVPRLPQGGVGAFNDVLGDDKGHVWAAGASTGLWQLKQGTSKFVHIDNVPERLWSVDIDNQGQLWLGTAGNGAVKYNPDTGETSQYTLEDGLLNNVVLNIRQDNQGNMWLFTDKGLSLLSAQDNDIRTFVEQDGLQSNTFTTAGFFDKQTGWLWTGGVNGFNRFKPGAIKPLNKMPEVKLTNFELYYKPVALNGQDSTSPLSQVIGHTEQLLLSHEQNVFAFEFSALEYAAPDSMRFAFKLDGYDDDWNIVGADRRFANYTNIDPGEYVFRVMAINSDGQWSDKQTTVDIIIAPPWWSTKPAIVGYLLSLWLAVHLFVVFRTKSLSARAKSLEQAVDKRTEELAKEKQKVEQLLAQKNEEFATVSHEFRTPLTLVLGPLSQILSDTKDQHLHAKLGMIQRNGYRLLRMVDQLLNLETFKVKAINQKQPQPSGKIIRLVCEAFSDLSKEKQIELDIKAIAEVNFALIPDALEKILLNLLSNALKYSNTGSKISVLSERTSKNELRIIVSDTGIGIPEDKIGQVFERYQRVHDRKTKNASGAGIGLALVKSLVEVHHGRVELNSEVGKGTTVEVFLPIVDEVNELQSMDKTNEEFVAMELMSITASTQSPVTNEQIEPVEDTQQPLVLVIEDNADMRSYIEQSIDNSYRVICAPDGDVGVSMAIEYVPDIVISDIMMPQKDGYQVTRELRENPLTNHIPIVLLTAKGDRDSRLKGWDEKVDEYLTKPFDAQELNIRVANLLDIRNILKKSFAESTFSHNAEQQKTAVKAKDLQQQAFVDKLDGVIEGFYTDASISIGDFAEKMAMSERQLFRKLKSVLDVTPAEYLRRYRLEKARALLAQGQSVSFVTFEVGFSTQSYFGKCFKAQYGVPPGEYKKEVAG